MVDSHRAIRACSRCESEFAPSDVKITTKYSFKIFVLVKRSIRNLTQPSCGNLCHYQYVTHDIDQVSQTTLAGLLPPCFLLRTRGACLDYFFFFSTQRKQLLVSKVLPVFWPHTTSAHVATYNFCTGLMISVLRLRFEAFASSLLAFVSQVPIYIRFVLEIHR